MPLDRLRVKLCQARLLLARGDAVSANTALLAGFRWLRAYQSTLGSLELRAAGGGLSGRLVTLGVATAAAAEEAGNRPVVDGGGAGRPGGANRSAVYAGPEVASALDGLREVTALQAREGLDAGASLALRRRQVAWEEVVRRWSRHESGPAGRPKPLKVPDLARLLGTKLLIEYAIVDGLLVAGVLAGGRCRVVRLCPVEQFRAAVAQLRFAVNSTVRRPESGAQAVEGEALRLERLVVGPLELETLQEVIVVPEGVGWTVPWGALPALAKASIVVVASASNLLRRHRHPNLSKRPKIVVVVGPDLYHGYEEAQAVAAAWDGRARILHDPRGSCFSGVRPEGGRHCAHRGPWVLQ